MQTWMEAQEWERAWWGDCCNSYNEETKQYVYAHYMGLGEFAVNWFGRCGWDFGDRRVIDIGGGPCSMLLKSKAARRVVVDPCMFPAWVKHRYGECGIELWPHRGEKAIVGGAFDLALIYNCLQHVEDPAMLVQGVKLSAKELRIFEWIETGVADGHLHNLTAENLDKWIGQGRGQVRQINDGPCVGKAYFGIFPL